MRFGVALLLLAAVGARAPRALADESPAQRADRLFTEANRLANGGDFAAACPRYEESNAIDAAIGTQFNLADCYEHVGRLASALRLFRTVESTAHQAGKAERQASARSRADALVARVAHLRVHLAPAADVQGLEVLCDGVAIARADFERGVPLDPGPHEITARAPDRTPWSSRIEIAQPDGVDVPIPELARAASAAVVPPPPAPPPPASSTQKTAGLVVGSAGVAGLLVGAVTGILSIVEHGDYTKLCPTTTCANPSGVSESHTAVTEGDIATVALLVGGAALVGGGVLWLTAPKGPEAGQPSVGVAPTWNVAGGGLSVVGRF